MNAKEPTSVRSDVATPMARMSAPAHEVSRLPTTVCIIIDIQSYLCFIFEFDENFTESCQEKIRKYEETIEFFELSF